MYLALQLIQLQMKYEKLIRSLPLIFIPTNIPMFRVMQLFYDSFRTQISESRYLVALKRAGVWNPWLH